jgi:TrmH family RNA methyltransferase
MLSKAQNKYIRSLSQQKFRDEYKVFTAEGAKIAQEWLSAPGKINMIISTEDWATQQSHIVAAHPEAELHIVKEADLIALSTLKTPNHVILVVPLPEPKAIPVINGWCIALDELQDPGNMGTIIRIADWFGIGHVVVSPGCVNIYSPKVVQSAMGGHLRVNFYECELVPFLKSSTLPKIAATLDGQNVYHEQRMPSGILIIGNESKGISPKVASVATKKVMIPRGGGAESLNAAVSAGILCALLLPC